MMRLDLLAVSMARKTLWITDAYFMPTRMYAQGLINAAKDGVDVRVLVPSTSDIKWIGAVSRTQYRTLLEAGVRVFEWNGSMIHAKMSVVDGMWARVGSTNLNFSSWFANRELDVAIEDRATVDYLEQFGLNRIDPLRKSQHRLSLVFTPSLFLRLEIVLVNLSGIEINVSGFVGCDTV